MPTLLLLFNTYTNIYNNVIVEQLIMKILFNLNFIKLLLFILFTLYLTASCTGRVSNHGTLNIEKIINTIVDRKLEKAEIEALLGPPTTKSAFEFNKWYYIKSSLLHKSFYKPELIDHIVYEIIFNAQNEAIAINTYTKENLNKIAYNKDKTETKGNETTLIQQIFKDVLKSSVTK